MKIYNGLPGKEKKGVGKVVLITKSLFACTFLTGLGRVANDLRLCLDAWTSIEYYQMIITTLLLVGMSITTLVIISGAENSHDWELSSVVG